MKRYLLDQIEKDLGKKMVFLSGPRQVGKSTLARSLLNNDVGYLNWDTDEGREAILSRTFPQSPLLVFDELHKYRTWRNYLKGIYDLPSRKSKILVTGSARLDLYRRGGDSLQGRYHLLTLFPLSYVELGMSSARDLESLLAFGGFPEPFLAGSLDEARRWSREYRTRVLRDEVSSLEQIVDLGNLELLMQRLPALVGGPLSLNALREDLQVSHGSIRRWMDALERLYFVVRLSPFGSAKIKAVKKEQKHYHYDWSVVSEPGPRFENLVAIHLLKWVKFQQEVRGLEIELRYARSERGEEIDFVIVENGKHPLRAIECKLNDEAPSPFLRRFAKLFPKCETFQVTLSGKKDFQTAEGVRVCSAQVLLGQLI